MRFINNEAKQVEIRKLQNTLVVVGSGTIIFSLWTMIKFIGTFIILRKETVAGVIADNHAFCQMVYALSCLRTGAEFETDTYAFDTVSPW